MNTETNKTSTHPTKLALIAALDKLEAARRTEVAARVAADKADWAVETCHHTAPARGEVCEAARAAFAAHKAAVVAYNEARRAYSVAYEAREVYKAAKFGKAYRA
jgi:hypothetical protein